jgi:hypothetical protein
VLLLEIARARRAAGGSSSASTCDLGSTLNPVEDALTPQLGLNTRLRLLVWEISGEENILLPAAAKIICPV